MDGDSFKTAAKESTQEEVFTFSRVMSRTGLRTWLKLFPAIFTDPGDRISNKEALELFQNPELSHFHLVMKDRKPAGIELIQRHPDIAGAIYIPYAGMATEYRNGGVYKLVAKRSDEIMKYFGAQYCLYDLEDPSRPDNLCKAYPDEDRETVIKRATGRINFWQRSFNPRVFVVNDPEVPYMRPSSENLKNIQAYDVLSFRPLDLDDPKWKKVFNADRTAISRQAYRDMYVEIMQLQGYGTPGEVEATMRKDFPAIDKFLTTLDASKKDWIALESGYIRPKATADRNVRVEITPPIRDRIRPPRTETALTA